MNESLDITKIDVITLKSLVYDELARIEQGQSNIRIINQELIKRQSEKKEQPEAL